MIQPDWPNQQLVRPDGSGPGMNTPPGLPSDVVITYGHAGLSYEFLLRTYEGGPLPLAAQVDWWFGDGDSVEDVDAAVPVAHTYAQPGLVTVTSHIRGGRTRSLALVVEA